MLYLDMLLLILYFFQIKTRIKIFKEILTKIKTFKKIIMMFGNKFQKLNDRVTTEITIKENVSISVSFHVISPVTELFSRFDCWPDTNLSFHLRPADWPPEGSRDRPS